jgi:hypothetical protein
MVFHSNSAAQQIALDDPAYQALTVVDTGPDFMWLATAPVTLTTSKYKLGVSSCPAFTQSCLIYASCNSRLTEQKLNSQNFLQ